MLLATTALLNGSNDLILSGDGGTNDIRLSLANGAVDLRLEDPNGLTAAAPEFTADGANAYRIALADFSGAVIVSAAGGADSLTIDNAGGILPLLVTFSGGADSDALIVTGDPGISVAREAYVVGGSQDAGTWTLDPDGMPGNGDALTVNFTGLEPVDTDTPSTVFDVVLSAGADDLTIEDGGLLAGANAASVVDHGGTFESFRFANKDTVRISGGDGADRFFVDNLIPAAGLNSLELYGHDVTGTDTTDDAADDVFIVNHYGDPAKLTIDGGAGNNAVTHGDRFEDNDSFATAADVGVAPGVHINRLSLYPAGDEDWYQVEVLTSNEAIDVAIDFDHAFGNLDLSVHDDQGTLIGSSTSVTDDEEVQLTGLASGTYYVRVFGDANAYSLAMDPGATSSTQVYYVNDSAATDDLSVNFYTAAAGDDANSGMSHLTPKATVQDLIDTVVLGPTSLVLIDEGTYTSTVTLTSADEGGIFAGTPHTGGGTGSDFSAGTTRWKLVDADFNTLFLLTFGGSGGSTGIFADSGVANDSTNNTFRRNQFLGTSTAIRIDDGESDQVLENVVSGNGIVGIDVNNSVSVVIRGNHISGRNDGISVTAQSSTIDDNRVSAGTEAIRVDSTGTAVITGNTITASSTGILIGNAATATISGGNQIFGNVAGISSSTVQTQVFGNEIYNNTTGIEGLGTFGGTSWAADQVNDIHDNATGIGPRSSAFNATIRFNRIHHNDVGILAEDNGSIHHNVIFRNVNAGIRVIDGSGIDISNNTVYSPGADAVQVQDASQGTTLTNNIIWATGAGKFGVRVATDSQVGFDSDYNNLFASGGAGVVHWQKAFGDLFDWQAEANLDNNSIGFTALNPTLDDPQFVDLAGDDYRVTAAVSTSIDAGDPASLFPNEPAPAGGRINLGAYGDTSLAATSRAAYVEVDFPNYYTDLQVDLGQIIFWHSYDDAQGDDQVTGSLDIDLHEWNPSDPTPSGDMGKVADIATTTASAGSVGWTPSSLVSGETAKRYRIRITALDGSYSGLAMLEEFSRESFSIVPLGDAFFVNDGSNTNDQYTSVVGNNRNTGQAADDPKANLLPLLRSYDLGPGDVTYIDNGDYVHVRNTIISGATGVGDDEGSRFTGPNPNEVGVNPYDMSMEASIDRGNPFDGSTNIELDDGDFVTLEYLTLTGASDGLIVHNGSTNFSGNHLTVHDNADDGMLIESDAAFTTIDALTAFNNGGDGIFIQTAISSLKNSVAYDNSGTGIRLTSQAGVVLENNESYGNDVGIFVANASGSQAVVGNLDLSLGLGNVVHDNRSTGIEVTTDVLVAGNTVFGQSGSNDWGIRLTSLGSEARRNIVHSNDGGIYSIGGGSVVAENRVYNHTGTGIEARTSTDVLRNVIYTNDLGLLATNNTAPFTGTVQNNIVYDNASGAILADSAGSSGNGADFFNNTVFQETGDAIRIEGHSENVDVRSNILWVDSGFAISVADDSQIDFTSDFNLLHTTGTGQTAYWQGLARPDLVAWQNTVFTDGLSSSQNPLFVDVVPGATLGYISPADDGRNDDFHVQSDNGSFHGGSLAPVLDSGSGLPVFQVATLTSDAARSPAIDRGDDSFPFAAEPVENGGFINVGAYGNTDQASKSPAEFVLVLIPDGGETWVAGQSFDVRWRTDAQGMGGINVNIDLKRDGDAGFHYNVAAATPDNGAFSFAVPDDPVNLPPATDYRVEISRTDNGALVDQSNNPFSVTGPVSTYYVNLAADPDGLDNEYVDPNTPGNDANDGLTPSTPKATIRGVLEAYDLGPSDTILVDTGTYTLDSNIAITAADAGVTIQGAMSAGNETILDRSNTSSGSYVIELDDADNVTLAHVTLTGAQYGVYAANGSDSDNLVIRDSYVRDNSTNNIRIGNDSDAVQILSSRSRGASIGLNIDGDNATIHDNEVWDATTGIDLNGDNAMITSNRVYGNTTGINAASFSSGPITTVEGNYVFHNSSTGIDVFGNVLITANTVYGHDGSGDLRIDALGAAARVIGNTVFGNYDGIEVDNNAKALNNTVYNQGNIGVRVRGGSIARENHVYDNAIGIEGINSSGTGFHGLIENNLVYENTTSGVRIRTARIQRGSSPRIWNNTIYQSTGDAVRIENSSEDVDVRNNVLRVDGGGFALAYDTNSQVGVTSDYNIFRLVGGSQLADWGGVPFANRVDWFYELGFDGNSLEADPQFIDIAGPADGILGYDPSPTGPAMIMDDGDTGYVTVGTWVTTSGSGGFNDDYQQTDAGDGSSTATWTFSGLTAGETYRVSATWQRVFGTNASDSPFTVLDGGSADVIGFRRFSQRTTPSGFEDGGTTWQDLGVFTLDAGSTSLVVQLDSLAGGAVEADAVRIEPLKGDRGADDDFHVLNTSLAVDGGDPLSYYLAEPRPSGARVNVGRYGNTDEATLSPDQIVQVLSPNGFEKFEVGQATDIRWRSAGLTDTHVVALMNAGGATVDNWLFDRYQTDGATSQSFSNAVDTSAVTNPAPEAVYQRYARATSSTSGSRLVYELPTQNGTYDVRLHFVEPSTTTVGNRVFDIDVNGNVMPAFDILVASGARYTAAAVDFSGVVAAGGAGITVELTNVTGQAVLSGIEIAAANPLGVASPAVDLELSTNSGATFASIAGASGLAMDRFGRGSFLWTASPQTSGNTALVRASANSGSMPHDDSNEPFLIAGAGSEYFINLAADPDGNDNEYVDPFVSGDNTNSGKTPSDPMASVRALFNAYDLDSGDTVFVDTGSYSLVANLLIDVTDAGVTLQGARTAGNETILDRANTSNDSYVVQLVDANDVILDHLTLTGGEFGVYANTTSDSDNLTIRNSFIRDNQNNVFIGRDNDSPTIINSRIRGGSTGLNVDSDGAVIAGNSVWDASTGMDLDGRGASVTGNRVYGNGTGMNVNSNGDTTTISSNDVFQNTSIGIDADGNVVISGNTVYGHVGSNDRGIVGGGPSIRILGNTVFDNFNGIQGDSGALIEGNTVYNHTGYGIRLTEETVARGNHVYDSSSGIEAAGLFRGAIENNLIYEISNTAILISNARMSGVDFPRVWNNTVYQRIGDAVRVENGSTEVDIRNNIFRVENGFVYSFDVESPFGNLIDYNVLDIAPPAHVAEWGPYTIENRADWFYELGFDGNSVEADPQFIDIVGPQDGVLGYDGSPAGPPAVIIDDGEPGYATTGGPWVMTSGSGGFDNDYERIDEGDGSSVASWTFSGLTPGATYRVSATWQPISGGNDNAVDAPYTVIDDGTGDVVGFRRISQRNTPVGFDDAGVTWRDLVNVVSSGTSLTVRLDNFAEDAVLADAIRIEQLVGNRGADDDFRLQSGSPAIDAGYPLSYYTGEPRPNGDRANAGRYGNTAEAATSASQIVQVVAPNGFEKFEQGQITDIRFRSAGLTETYFAALINAGGATEENWLFNNYQSTGGDASTSNAVDRTMVTQPAPEAVYQHYARATNGVAGSRLVYDIPLPDGSYDLRLHFVEPTVSFAGSRVFDIDVNGTVLPAFDIFDRAGGRSIAVTEEFAAVVAAGGTGISIELTNVVNQAILSGIEITSTNPLGVSSPTVDLELSTDSGGSFAAITGAGGLAIDRFGDGSFTWSADPVTGANTALVRVFANDGTLPQDDSDEPFLIAGAGTDYFVNLASDPNGTDNEFVDPSTPGDNAASGKAPADPMASLVAVLRAYDLDPGYTIFIDTGEYDLLTNGVISAADAGVAIQGAMQPGNSTVIDRASPLLDHVAIELVNADDVMLDSLEITGGFYGVLADHGWGSDGVVIRNSLVRDNTRGGIFFGSSNDNVQINDTIVVGGTTGIEVVEVASVTGGEVSAASTGIRVNHAGSSVTGVSVHDNSTGISAAGSGTVVAENTVFNNSSTGISVSTDALVMLNTVFGHNGVNDVGISADDSRVLENFVHSNYDGIVAYSRAFAESNRVFNNSNIGITTRGVSDVLGNAVYSNSIGIYAVSQGGFRFQGQITNNLVYANTNTAILVTSAGASTNRPEVINNTVFQEVGDALRVESSSQDVFVRNNVFLVDAGYAIFVASNSQAGFDSQYNLFEIGTDPNGHVGFWNSTVQDTLFDWNAASGQDDARSLEGTAAFVDPAGADNILGYTAAGGGFDAGPDDNFFVIGAGSEIIDRGETWNAPRTDILGQVRMDDPGQPNIGAADYGETDLGASQFASTGTAQNLHSGSSSRLLNFPGGFEFDFYDVSFTSVVVSTNGFLQFGSSDNATDGSNTFAEFLTQPRIAAVWDDLTTVGGTNDVYVDATTTDELTIRWEATNVADGSPVNAAVTLFSNSHVTTPNRIELHYGSGNTNLTPTIGISRGDGQNFLLSDYDGQAALTGVNSVAIQATVAGIVDLGAYEFRGDSNDMTPPIVTATAPAVVAASGTTDEAISAIELTVSEAVNEIDANAQANYELRDDGGDAIFDNGNDVVYSLTPNYVPGSVTVQLTIDAGVLPAGNYRLTASGDTSIHDLAGNRLDGDNDTNEGGNYVRVFTIEVTQPQINARHIFYNNSNWDGSDDQDAIATDKQPLLAGQPATFANYTSSAAGINGVLIEVEGFPGIADLSTADFEFHIGNTDLPSTWSMAPDPTVNVRENEGPGDSDLIVLTWPDESLRNTWLEVKVLATSNTGLPADGVFYFGNAVGESGDSAAQTLVNGFDFAGARDNVTATASIDLDYDYNRDGSVDGADLAIARDHSTNFLTAFRLIDLSVMPPPISLLVVEERFRGQAESDEERSTAGMPEATDAAIVSLTETSRDSMASHATKNPAARSFADERTLDDLTFELGDRLKAES